jgi:hypothetical protein
MTNATTGLDRFVALSVALTGVDASQLKPDIDPIQIADQYYQLLHDSVRVGTHVSQTIDSLLETNEQRAGTTGPDHAVEFILADKNFGPIARSILKLWLLGTWYDPENPDNPRDPFVVSAQAYKESLVWKVMQSHPMGYSMFSFGYWAKEPPAFEQFITFDPSTQGGTYHG